MGFLISSGSHFSSGGPSGWDGVWMIAPFRSIPLSLHFIPIPAESIPQVPFSFFSNSQFSSTSSSGSRARTCSFLFIILFCCVAPKRGQSHASHQSAEPHCNFGNSRFSLVVCDIRTCYTHSNARSLLPSPYSTRDNRKGKLASHTIDTSTACNVEEIEHNNYTLADLRATSEPRAKKVTYHSLLFVFLFSLLPLPLSLSLFFLFFSRALPTDTLLITKSTSSLSLSLSLSMSHISPS
ncbi:unnamed protein product [Acanthosepion pharaonis]|uniref:Uncharacterized protein n=1 Tax=Acanthosepion pharaonis TaxID=158019 RepID=A0A812AY21_ACAPH|nr:unnamed protein product [Sepia pharaonis]